MIVYNKLWQTMKDKGITQYALINQHHMSAGQLSRLRKNQNISSHTINTLCEILDCQPGDIMERGLSLFFFSQESVKTFKY